MPFYPQEGESKVRYETYTRGEKQVIDYTGLTLIDIQELDLDVYLFLMREGYIYDLSQSPEGREYLENCWRLEQSKPDREALREKFGKKGG